MSKARHRIWHTLWGVGLIIVGGYTSVSAAPSGLIHSLKMSGFQVTQGYPKLYTFQDCVDHTYPTLKNCFLANPAAPSVVPVVKSWPNEYVNPAMVNAFAETESGYSTAYRLDPREAIVIYGKMPPPGRYMGLQTWQFSEHGKWTPRDYEYWANQPDLPVPMQYLFDTVPPDDPKSHRLISLSALGDVVNTALPCATRIPWIG